MSRREGSVETSPRYARLDVWNIALIHISVGGIIDTPPKVFHVIHDDAGEKMWGILFGAVLLAPY